MSENALKIQIRFQKNYVTKEQLTKYLSLGVITEDEYNIILNSIPISDIGNADEAMDIIQGVE